MTPEITKCATLSIKSISQETYLKLQQDAYDSDQDWPLTVYEKEFSYENYGFFIYPHDSQAQSDSENIPEDLQKCLDIMRQNDCDFLSLDSDITNVPIVTHCLTISTTHIKREDLAKLQTEPNIGVYKKDNLGTHNIGIYVYVNRFANNKVKSLQKCIQYAKDQGCEIICFDSDGPIMPELPVYKYD